MKLFVIGTKGDRLWIGLCVSVCSCCLMYVEVIVNNLIMLVSR